MQGRGRLAKLLSIAFRTCNRFRLTEEMADFLEHTFGFLFYTVYLLTKGRSFLHCRIPEYQGHLSLPLSVTSPSASLLVEMFNPELILWGVSSHYTFLKGKGWKDGRKKSCLDWGPGGLWSFSWDQYHVLTSPFIC